MITFWGVVSGAVGTIIVLLVILVVLGMIGYCRQAEFCPKCGSGKYCNHWTWATSCKSAKCLKCGKNYYFEGSLIPSKSNYEFRARKLPSDVFLIIGLKTRYFFSTNLNLF